MAHARAGQGVYAELAELLRMKHLAAGFTFLPRQPVTSLLAGRRASRLRGRGLSFEELRAYRPGDDTRQMDWRATARLRKPQVRVYTEERDRPTILVVDQRTSMFFGSRRKMKSVVAAEAAALAAWRVLDQDDRVGAIVFGSDALDSLRPQRSANAVVRILETIVRINRQLKAGPEAGEAPEQLNAALELAARTAAHDHLVVVISDFDGMDGETERLLRRIAAHNDVVAVGVFDQLGRTLPAAGRLAFERARHQVEVDTGADAVRERFQRHFDERVAAVRTFFLRLHVPLLLVSAEREVVDQVLEQLGGTGR